MVLTGWTLAKNFCLGWPDDYDVVIGKSSTSLIKPVNTDCTANALITSGPNVKSSGNVTMEITVQLLDAEDSQCAEFNGNYVGIKKVNN